MLLLLLACATKSISGSIYSQTGEPLPDAIISMEDQQTVSDPNGQFTIDSLKLKKGEYTITITHEGYVFTQESLSVTGTHFLAPAMTLTALDVSIPYFPINLDPTPPKRK